MTVAFVPLAIMTFNIESIMVKFGQDANVAKYTQQYLLAYLPGLYITGLQNCQQKFLNNLKKAKFPMYSQIFASVMHLFWSYFLVSKSQMNLGIIGTGISMVIANSTVFFANLIYTSSCEDI